jgi:hypothetical protein
MARRSRKPDGGRYLQKGQTAIPSAAKAVRIKSPPDSPRRKDSGAARTPLSATCGPGHPASPDMVERVVGKESSSRTREASFPGTPAAKAVSRDGSKQADQSIHGTTPDSLQRCPAKRAHPRRDRRSVRRAIDLRYSIGDLHIHCGPGPACDHWSRGPPNTAKQRAPPGAARQEDRTKRH